jgi:hypothetical protein
MGRYSNPPIHIEKSTGWSGKKGNRKKGKNQLSEYSISKTGQSCQVFFGRFLKGFVGSKDRQSKSSERRITAFSIS